jgi:hypothetical protein
MVPGEKDPRAAAADAVAAPAHPGRGLSRASNVFMLPPPAAPPPASSSATAQAPAEGGALTSMGATGAAVAEGRPRAARKSLGMPPGRVTGPSLDAGFEATGPLLVPGAVLGSCRVAPQRRPTRSRQRPDVSAHARAAGWARCERQGEAERGAARTSVCHCVLQVARRPAWGPRACRRRCRADRACRASPQTLRCACPRRRRRRRPPPHAALRSPSLAPRACRCLPMSRTSRRRPRPLAPCRHRGTACHPQVGPVYAALPSNRPERSPARGKHSCRPLNGLQTA